MASLDRVATGTSKEDGRHSLVICRSFHHWQKWHPQKVFTWNIRNAAGKTLPPHIKSQPHYRNEKRSIFIPVSKSAKTHQLLVPVAVKRVLHWSIGYAPTCSPNPVVPARVARLQTHPHEPRSVDSCRDLNGFRRPALVIVRARCSSALRVEVHAADVASGQGTFRSRGGLGMSLLD